MTTEPKHGTTYWLVERNPNGKHEWLRIFDSGFSQAIIGWTDNAFAALRFSREDDARNFILLHQLVLAFPTEHLDMERDVNG